MTRAANPANDLLRTAARLSRWASQVASFDIPFAQARLLALVDEYGPVRVSALAAHDHSSQPTVTAQLQRMETAGWVRREPDPADARATLVSLTPEGITSIERVRAARAAVLEPFVNRLDGQPLERIRVAVDVMTELLEVASSHPEPRKDG